MNFISHGAGYTVFLAGNAAVLSLQSHDDGYRLLQKMDARTRKRFESRRFYRLSPRFHLPTKADVIRVAIMGANPSANAQPLDQLPGKVSSFVGGEPMATRDWAMVLLAYRHSLRGSEVCGLKLSDIDLKVSSISIRRLKGSLQTVQPLYPHRGQPLLDEVNALRSWFREPEHDGSDYLLTSQKGGRLDRTQFFRIFRACAEAAGLTPEKRHPHVLKHSLASHLVAANANRALVRQALGHRSITSTLQHVGTSDGQAAEAAQAALMRLY